MSHHAHVPFHLLQIADSACPTGSFVHSGGVEELFRSGVVSDADDLFVALESYVRQSLVGRELLFVSLAYEASTSHDVGMLTELVRVRRATRLTHQSRASDRSRGRSLLRTLEEMRDPSPLWEPAADSFAVLFGVAGAVFEAGRDDVLSTFAFSQVSGMAQAAVRLGRIGPNDAQYVLGRLDQAMHEAVTMTKERKFGEWHGFSPRWELAQARHDGAPSPLFLT